MVSGLAVSEELLGGPSGALFYGALGAQPCAEAGKLRRENLCHFGLNSKSDINSPCIKIGMFDIQRASQDGRFGAFGLAFGSPNIELSM